MHGRNFGAPRAKVTRENTRHCRSYAQVRRPSRYLNGEGRDGPGSSRLERDIRPPLRETTSRHTILVPIRGGHSAQQVGDALIGVFSALPPALRRTLTWDQGNEMFLSIAG
jgi:hypothetical protein